MFQFQHGLFPSLTWNLCNQFIIPQNAPGGKRLFPGEVRRQQKTKNNRNTLQINLVQPIAQYCCERFQRYFAGDSNSTAPIHIVLSSYFRSHHRSFLHRSFPGRAAQKRQRTGGGLTRQLCAVRFQICGCRGRWLRSKWCCRRPAGPDPETWSSPEPRPPGNPPAFRRAYPRCG